MSKQIIDIANYTVNILIDKKEFNENMDEVFSDLLTNVESERKPKVIYLIANKLAEYGYVIENTKPLKIKEI